MFLQSFPSPVTFRTIAPPFCPSSPLSLCLSIPFYVHFIALSTWYVALGSLTPGALHLSPISLLQLPLSSVQSSSMPQSPLVDLDRFTPSEVNARHLQPVLHAAARLLRPPFRHIPFDFTLRDSFLLPFLPSPFHYLSLTATAFHCCCSSTAWGILYIF